MQKIKRGDTVIVTAGKCKGMRGAVLKRVADDRIIVEGINMVKKHVRPNPQRGVEGGIVEREASLHVSNVAMYNPATKKADRVGIKFLKDGRKVRFFKSNDEVIDA